MKIVELMPGKLYLSGQIDNWNALKNITAIVNMQIETIDFPSVNWEKKIIVWAPIWDTTHYELSVDSKWIAALVDGINVLLGYGHTVLIHCAQGENRSGMVAVAFLMKHNNWTAEEALEFVRSKQPKAVWNPVWQKRLKEYEELLNS